MYYLKLSGIIPEPKQKEFEQTFRFAISQIPKACNAYNMTRDALQEELFQFVSYWDSISALNAFKKSSTYLMLMGAYSALGILQENQTGEISVNGNQSSHAPN